MVLCGGSLLLVDNLECSVLFDLLDAALSIRELHLAHERILAVGDQLGFEGGDQELGVLREL